MINPEEIIEKIQSKRDFSGAFSKEEFYDLIDETITEYRQQGLIDEDEDIEHLRSELRSRWSEINNTQD